jgi:aminopeptidase N
VRIALAEPSAEAERRVLTIAYRGVPADGLIISRNMHGDRTFFGDNFSTRFRHWLPGIDHPYDKATCEFAIDAPNHYQVIANGLLAEETDLAGGRRLTRWRQSVPISTYLMVIGVARFAVQHVETFDGVPIQTWVYAQDRDAGFHDFGMARQPLAFFIARVGPYPYEKLANVQSKTRYGGMENASNIFYGERSVSGQRRSAGTVVHEIAHQWFGDSVTEADWAHVWLSEGFATYFTQLYNEFTYGRDRLEAGMASSRTRVTQYFHRVPDSPVVDPSVPAEDAIRHGANVYQKGGWALHMLRREVGDEDFWSAIREYYRRHRDANTLTDDLRRVFEEVSGEELEWFFRQWLHTPGHPILEGDWAYDAGAGRVEVRLRQTQPVDRAFIAPLDVSFSFGQGAPRIETVRLDEREETFTFQLDRAPTSVELDPDVWLLMEATFGRRGEGAGGRRR